MERTPEKRSSHEKKLFSRKLPNNFHELFVDFLNFYDLALVEKTSSQVETDFTQEQLQTYFDYCLTVVCFFQGEINGHAVFQISQENCEQFPDSAEEFQAFFIEVGNTILGHFLTDLDKKKNLLAQLHSPFIFKPMQKSSTNEGIKKNRILSLLSSLIGTQEVDKINYNMTYKNKNYAFHVILFSQRIGIRHD